MKIVRHLIPEVAIAYAPPGDGPFPALLVLHGSEGGASGWSHRTAVLLAAHGFCAMPFAYSRDGNAWNAGNIRDVPIDRTVDALQALRDHELAAHRVGLFGASRGAEHALLMASLMLRDGVNMPPDAIAVHSPADVVCGAFDARRWRDRGDPGWQVWDPGERAWTWRGRSDDLLPTTPIEIERYGGPLFISHGTADTMWSVEMTRRLEARLIAAGRKPEVHYFEGEDHLLSTPAENLFHTRLIDFFTRNLSPR
nr:acyl-CoA thioester hydrolase/BAAT C-terminal domain-containing protein [Rhodovibrio salinarum]